MVEFKKPKINFLVKTILLFILAGQISVCHSYILTESTQRVPIRWSSPNLQINIDASLNDNIPRNNIFCRGPFFDSLEDEDFSSHCNDFAITEINQTLSSWNLSSPVGITSNPFSTNKLSFSSDPRFFSPGVVAITLLSYNPGDGIIKNGQIYINHMTNPGFCFTKEKSALSCVYLGDVVAHEMGHFAGLAHSEVRDSTMLFSSFRGQHSLHSDDIAGLRSIYSPQSHGKIMGRVMGGNRVPVFGAHIQAISSQSGDIAAAAVSQEDGSFVINGLDLNQTYYLYTEPLRKSDSLPDAFRSAQTNFCPGSYVGSFFESCGSQSRGQPQPLSLSNSKTTLDVGVVSIRCQTRVDSYYLDTKLRDGKGIYEFVSQPNKPLSGFVGYYPATELIDNDEAMESKSDTLKLDLSSISNLDPGSLLRIKVLSTAIGSPIDFMIKIDGPFGISVDPDRLQFNPEPGRNYSPPNQEPFTLKRIFQRSISYPLSTDSNDNYLEITLSPRLLDSEELSMSLPSSSLFRLKDRPYFLMFEIVKGNEVLVSDIRSNISDNLNCLDAPFTFAVKANNVSAAAIAGQTDEGGQSQVIGASCATIEPPGSGGGMGPFSFILGLLILLFIPQKIRSKS